MQNLLIINSGSSSLKVSLYNLKTLTSIAEFHDKQTKNYTKTLQKIVQKLKKYDIHAVSHRVVHGGETYTKATLITPKVIKDIQKLSNLAPLHNPINLECIKEAQRLFKCPHYAIFDTAFFAKTLPAKAYLYGIPNKYYYDNKIRKYGFHGINHNYVYSAIQEKLDIKKPSGIICHLGNGCSISCIKNGKPIDVSMGFTPLDGLIMSTRSGSLDPAIIFHLQKRYPRMDVQKLLLHKSGLLGLSQISSNMKEIYEAAKKGHIQSKIAIDTFCYKAASYVGFYSNLLPELDFIAFSGGIGENAPYIRKKIFRNLPGLVFDSKDAYIINADEAKQIAFETKKAHIL